jgi:hypothetical protein
MTKPIHFKKGKLPGCAWVAFALTGLLGVLIILAGSFLGIIFLVPMIAMFGVREGVIIDVENKKCKSYLSIFGFNTASWKPLPEGTVIGIRILKLAARRVVGHMTMDSVGTSSTFELYLYTPKPDRIALKTSDNVEKLYFEAQNLSMILGHEIIVDQRIPEELYNKGL